MVYDYAIPGKEKYKGCGVKLSNRLYPTIDDLEAAVDEAWLWISNQQEELSNLCLFPWIKSALVNWN